MKIVQASLTGTTPNHEVLKMTTWLDVRPDLKEGVVITLKGFEKVQWYVDKLYDGLHDAADFEFHRKWDNNDYSKHEGLKL